MTALSSVSYALGNVFVNGAYAAGVQPGTAAFLRFAVASLALVPFLTLSGRWTPLPRKKIVTLLLLGLLAYSALGITWFLSISLSPVWLVALVNAALLPLLVNVGSWAILGEAIDRHKGLALTLVIAGSLALFWQPFEDAVLSGVLVMVGNCIIYALFQVVAQRWTRGVPPEMSAAWMCIGAMPSTLLYAHLVGELSFGFAPLGWLWAALFGLISTALAIMCLWWGIGLIGAARAAIISAIDPPLSVLFSVVILGQPMAPAQVVGGVIILIGVVLIRIQPKRRVPRP